MEQKSCKNCNVVKSVSAFYIVGARKDGSSRYHPFCKDCTLLYSREKYKSNPEYKEKRKERAKHLSSAQRMQRVERSAAFYKSKRGRAMVLLKGAIRRSHKHGDEITIDFDFIYNRLVAGVCEVTGIAFDFDKPDSSKNNPYAPSIDRIDSTKGYTKENTRLVIWQFNLMKGELSDDELYRLCKLIIESKNNGLDL